jgi:hypothetical protein
MTAAGGEFTNGGNRGEAEEALSDAPQIVVDSKYQAALG